MSADRQTPALIREASCVSARKRKTSPSGPSKERARLIGAAACICLTAAAALLVYPLFSDTLVNMRQNTELGAYEESLNHFSGEELERQRLQVREYNDGIEAAQRRKSFSYRGEHATDAVYDSLLNNSGDGVMAELKIPSLKLDLPVAHGTRAEDLEYRCGHMYGTSLPAGGEGTHAVIAGHTGLVTADLFTHLDQLKKGDVFYLAVLSEMHVYEVAEIRVVLPEEESCYLGIREGEDLVTLYTCTPYGINDHRLLVTGRRRFPDLSNDSGGGPGIRVSTLEAALTAKAAALAALPLLIPLLFLIRIRKEKRMKGMERGMSI